MQADEDYILLSGKQQSAIVSSEQYNRVNEQRRRRRMGHWLRELAGAPAGVRTRESE